MADAKASTTRRGRRSNRESVRLEQMRRRNAEQLAARQHVDDSVESGLRQYAEAADRVAAAETQRDTVVKDLEAKIAKARAAADRLITAAEADLARAAWQIHEPGERTIAQVADLVGVAEKAARQLVQTGRQLVDTDTAPEPPRAKNPASPSAGPTDRPSSDRPRPAPKVATIYPETVVTGPTAVKPNTTAPL